MKNKKSQILLTMIMIGLTLCSLLLLASCGARAEKPVELTAAEGEPANGFLWENNYSEITITGYVGDSNDLVVPTKINGKPVTTIKDKAFKEFSALRSIAIPDSVTSIGESAFSWCSSLESVHIGNGMTSIGGYAFNQCSSLVSINIPDSVTSIGNSAFWNCSGLEIVHIGNGVTSIGWDAFRGCSSLVSINIPDGVTSIGDDAFSGCSSLETIYYTGTQEQWDKIYNIKYALNGADTEIVYNYKGE